MASPLPQFLYQLKLTRPGLFDDGGTEAEQAALARHASWLERQHGDGVVHFAGRTTTDDHRTFGIVVLNAADATAAEALMNADPAVRDGVMRATLFPFRIAFG